MWKTRRRHTPDICATRSQQGSQGAVADDAKLRHIALVDALR